MYCTCDSVVPEIVCESDFLVPRIEANADLAVGIVQAMGHKSAGSGDNRDFRAIGRFAFYTVNSA